VKVDDVDMIEVAIEDNGNGIPEENRENLFTSARRLSRHQNIGGNGFALFVLHHRMQALKGACGVKNRLDGNMGSRFWFRFPYVPDIGEEDMTFKLTRRLSFGPIAGVIKRRNIYNVLVIDDSTVILRMVKMSLEKEGHIVTTAANGADGLAKLNVTNASYDVILSDIQMPVMDGIEFIKRLRENEILESLYTGRDKHQLVIAMSANASAGDGTEYITAGMDAFLAKPFSNKQFNQILEAHMASPFLKGISKNSSDFQVSVEIK
jgi:CheY-like chemotaxis protein